jgi:hypothetical protein
MIELLHLHEVPAVFDVGINGVLGHSSRKALESLAEAVSAKEGKT